jgi:RNA polymerase sigma-70 factor, ECF subfamily
MTAVHNQEPVPRHKIPPERRIVAEIDLTGDDELSSAVRSAQAGDEHAFGVMYRAVQPGLLRYLRLLVGTDAEDVASETWLQIVRDLGSFAGDGTAFRRWAVTVGRHRALDHLRRLQRRPVASATAEVLMDVPDPEDTAVNAVDAIGTRAALTLIASLPAEQAEAVMLRAVVGLDAAAAGAVLGKSAGAVRTAAYRGLRRLAQLIEPAATGHE